MPSAPTWHVPFVGAGPCACPIPFHLYLLAIAHSFQSDLTPESRCSTTIPVVYIPVVWQPPSNARWMEGHASSWSVGAHGVCPMNRSDEYKWADAIRPYMACTLCRGRSLCLPNPVSPLSPRDCPFLSIRSYPGIQMQHNHPGCVYPRCVAATEQREVDGGSRFVVVGRGTRRVPDEYLMDSPSLRTHSTFFIFAFYFLIFL